MMMSGAIKIYIFLHGRLLHGPSLSHVKDAGDFFVANMKMAIEVAKQ